MAATERLRPRTVPVYCSHLVAVLNFCGKAKIRMTLIEIIAKGEFLDRLRGVNTFTHTKPTPHFWPQANPCIVVSNV